MRPRVPPAVSIRSRRSRANDYLGARCPIRDTCLGGQGVPFPGASPRNLPTVPARRRPTPRIHQRDFLHGLLPVRLRPRLDRLKGRGAPSGRRNGMGGLVVDASEGVIVQARTLDGYRLQTSLGTRTLRVRDAHMTLSPKARRRTGTDCAIDVRLVEDHSARVYRIEMFEDLLTSSYSRARLVEQFESWLAEGPAAGTVFKPRTVFLPEQGGSAVRSRTRPSRFDQRTSRQP